AEIDMPRVPRILALNKIDRLKGEPLPNFEGAKDYDAVVPISALTGEGIDTLRAEIERVMSESMVEIKMTIPHQRGDLLSLIHQFGMVDDEQHSEEGVTIKAHVPRRLVSRLSSMDSPEEQRSP